MATYILRRCFSDTEEKKGMSTGAKIALGVGATAAAFAGARRGMLGNNAALKTNAMWGNLGAKIGNQGMMKSAATNLGKTAAKQAGKLTGTAANTAGNLRIGVEAKNSALNTWKGGGKVASFTDLASIAKQ